LTPPPPPPVFHLGLQRPRVHCPIPFPLEAFCLAPMTRTRSHVVQRSAAQPGCLSIFPLRPVSLSTPIFSLGYSLFPCPPVLSRDLMGGSELTSCFAEFLPCMVQFSNWLCPLLLFLGVSGKRAGRYSLEYRPSPFPPRSPSARPLFFFRVPLPAGGP